MTIPFNHKSGLPDKKYLPAHFRSPQLGDDVEDTFEPIGAIVARIVSKLADGMEGARGRSA